MKDCFGYDYGGCKALKSMKCEGCRFYKTQKQVDEGNKKAIDRILTLDKAQITAIQDKYYYGYDLFKMRERL